MFSDSDIVQFGVCTIFKNTESSKTHVLKPIVRQLISKIKVSKKQNHARFSSGVIQEWWKSKVTFVARPRSGTHEGAPEPVAHEKLQNRCLALHIYRISMHLSRPPQFVHYLLRNIASFIAISLSNSFNTLLFHHYRV